MRRTKDEDRAGYRGKSIRAQFLTALRDFAAGEGHLRVPQSHRERSYPLGQKVAATRMLDSNGKPARERVQQLEQLPGWVWRGGPPVS
jgi:hypothetical protein